MNFIRVLLKRNTALLLSAQLVSTMGSIMQTVALSLFVLKSGTGAQFASVLAVGMIPRLLGPLSGVVADRVNRRHMLVLLDCIAGILTVAFSLLYWQLQGLPLPAIYALVLMLGLIQSFYDPTVYSILPDVVVTEDLGNVNSASSAISNAAYIGIPALTGVLYPLIGLGTVMIINGVSFFAAAALETLLRYQPTHRQAEAAESVFCSFRRGVSTVLSSRELVLIVVISIMANLALNPIFTVGIPYIMNTDLKVQPWVFGMAQSVIFIGPVLGSLVAGSLLKRVDYRRLLIRILFLDCVMVAAIALLVAVAGGTEAVPAGWYTGIGGIILLAFLIVATMAVASIATITAMQQAVPGQLLGRVSGVVTSASLAAIPLGQWLFGGGLSLADSEYTCFFFAVLVFAAGIVAFVSYKPMLVKAERDHAGLSG